MNVGKLSRPSDELWTLLRALRETAIYFSGWLRVVRRPYERWKTVRLPHPVQSVLFVCKGNICRSPLAASYFQSLVEGRLDRIKVRSAGLETTPGKPAHPYSKAVALEQHLSLDMHATTQVHPELMDQSDLIVVMEIAQKYRIHRLYPNTKGKVVLLGYFNSAGPFEIADPYNGPIEEFRTCFEQVRRDCDALASRLALKRGTL